MAIFFQMMAKYTDIVKRAQIEIDNVTFRERLPTLDDRKELPIVDCIVKEVLRWASFIFQDDFYSNFCIDFKHLSVSSISACAGCVSVLIAL